MSGESPHEWTIGVLETGRLLGGRHASAPHSGGAPWVEFGQFATSCNLQSMGLCFVACHGEEVGMFWFLRLKYSLSIHPSIYLDR